MQRDQLSPGAEKLTKVLFFLLIAVLILGFASNYFKKNTTEARSQKLEEEKQDIRERPFFNSTDTGGVDPRNKEPIATTYKIGNDVTLTEGNIRINTEFYNFGDEIKGGYWYSGFSSYQKIKGEYIDVPLHFENQNKVPVDFFADNIILKDQIGRQYSPIRQSSRCSLSGDANEIPSTLGMTLNPNVPCDVHLLFEVATSSNAFMITFSSPN